MKAGRVVQVGVSAGRVTRLIEFSSVEDQYHATSYLDNDKREYELAEQVSMRLIDTSALS
jgi:hypothetical protein